MNLLYLTPYAIIEGQNYPEDSKIVIRLSDFDGVLFQDGRITFSFINCKFQNLEIENTESINFDNIQIQFVNCYIKEIKIEEFITTNFSVFFAESILQGRIKNKNLLNITLNNCLLNNALFLLDLNSVNISYTEENIFPRKWRKLLKSLRTDLNFLLKEKQTYHIQDTKEIAFHFNEKSNEKSVKQSGIYNRLRYHQNENTLGYFLTNEIKKEFKINLFIKYSANQEHILTKIINARLSALSLKGYSSGELVVESSKIDNLYIRDFSSQIGANFYNIKPFRNKLDEKKIEIHKSNLDKVWFDNIYFDHYSIISLYRNKFGQNTNMTSCEFPDNFSGFEKFKTIENVHYPDKIDDNYFKNRYETFLQLKKLVENSGNFYEAQKLQSVSHEALRKIDSIPFWDKQILKINSISNNHGQSIKEPFLGIVIFSILFYIIYLWSLGRMFNCNGINFNLIGYYFSFLDITHRSDFLVKKDELNGLSLTIDYLNKILVGFLIYQLIAAFRKYGKK